MNRWAVVLVLAFCVVSRPAASADLTADAVRKAIERGADFLKRQQRGDGSWSDGGHPAGGISSLVMLALVESGTKPDHPVIDQGLRYLRTIRATKSKTPPASNTYVVSLQTMVYCLARPREDLARIKENVAWLEDVQWKTGPMTGFALSLFGL